MYWLLAFVPVGLVLDAREDVPAALTFASAAIAIVPLAALLVRATEQIAERAGSAVGGLLNATFGNAPELIIAVVALRAGEIELVKASLVGVILGNLLFVLGISFLLGGLRHHEQLYNPAGARIQSSVMMIAALSLMVPSIFHNFITAETAHLEQDLNVAVAVVLLGAYVLSLLFMLKTHPDYFLVKGRKEHAEPGERWSPALAGGVLVGSSVVLAVVSEVLVGSVEETGEALGMSRVFIGVIVLAVVGGAAEALAALSMARNVASQEGRSIRRFMTAVFDLFPIPDPHREAPRTEAAYYFRPYKTLLVHNSDMTSTLEAKKNVLQLQSELFALG